jgi:hypothetical protein
MALRMTFSGSLVAALLAAGLVMGGCQDKKAAPTGKPDGKPAAGAAAAATVEYANAKCPIMGGAIDPAKVTADLSREWKGLKVAFCCPGCPGPWDKLTDAEKAVKLKPVLKPGVMLPAIEAAAKPAETKPAESKPAK